MALDASQEPTATPERSGTERPPGGSRLQENQVRRFLETKLQEVWAEPHRDPESITVLHVPGFRVLAVTNWFDEDDGVEGSFVGEPTPGEEEFFGQSWEWTVEVYDAEYDSWEPVGETAEGRHDEKPEIPSGVIDHLIENDFEIPLERSIPGLEF